MIPPNTRVKGIQCASHCCPYKVTLAMCVHHIEMTACISSYLFSAAFQFYTDNLCFYYVGINQSCMIFFIDFILDVISSLE